ncbi:MAG TPA: DUF2252 domain-containing protein [Bryobacteraceae bacterium]|jgi:uncharacterized protein (DUF2252 family)|nr:DUF2252 domain-containing protein [Bryobacteraceae bacterium]
MAASKPRISQAKTNGREQRLAQGRSHRTQLSRAALGQLHPRKPGFDSLQLLLSATEGRVPALLPVKYSRMMISPFAFFRGAVSIMAADLAREPHSGLFVQLCGDAHVQNLGSFEGPDGRLVFDINDFDETIPGPWEWDVKRMAASVVLAGIAADHRRSACASAVEAFAASYCNAIETLAEQPVLVAARHQVHGVRKAQAVSAALQQAQRANACDLLKKYTEKAARGRVQFKKIERAIWRLHGQRRQETLASLPLYKESLPPERLHLFDFFRPLDVAFKVVGTGSVGLRDYVVLMEGNGAEDPLFLQIKQEVSSAYAADLKGREYPNQGQRVAEGQRRIQPVSDLLLGWTRIGEHDYLVRQLNDHKGSVDLNNLKGEGLASLGTVAGELLARGHARSGDALMIKGYIGAPEKLLKSIVRYGLDYATLTEADFEIFKRAIEQERVKVAA